MHGSGGMNWGSGHHMENHKAVGFLRNAGMDPSLKNHKGINVVRIVGYGSL